MEMRLGQNVGELARDFLNEGFAVHFETWGYPELFDFPQTLVLALSCAYHRRPSCPLPRRQLTAKDCFAPARWDFAAPVAQSLPPFLRLHLEPLPVDALATRGKFAYGFLAVLHYPVAMILLLGSLLEMRWDSRQFPVGSVNALQLGNLLGRLPALVKPDLWVYPPNFQRFEEILVAPLAQIVPDFANALWTRSEKAKDC